MLGAYLKFNVYGEYATFAYGTTAFKFQWFTGSAVLDT